MITFLPLEDFDEVADILDYRRLGKQRVEVLQLLQANTHGGTYAAHPAAKMWRAHTNALVAYGLAICRGWIRRGYEDTTHDKILAFQIGTGDWTPPRWLGDSRLHSNHRARLLAKAPNYYRQFGWSEQPIEKNFWPLEALL